MYNILKVSDFFFNIQIETHEQNNKRIIIAFGGECFTLSRGFTFTHARAHAHAKREREREMHIDGEMTTTKRRD